MKKSIFLLLFSLLAGTGFSQVGVTTGAQFMQATEWEEHLQEAYNNSNITFFSPTVYVGLDYWFRLKNKRIEFTPEIGFASYSGSIPRARDLLNTDMETYKNNYFSFYFNSNIYLLDFGGDCNCPTFNKDGDLIKKGFFIRLSPGINYNIRGQKFEGISAIGETSFFSDEERSTNFSFRAGLGLDIGLSPFLTITPLIMGTYNTPVSWNIYLQESLTIDPVLVESQVLQLFAGIRLGFRFDEINKYGYR